MTVSRDDGVVILTDRALSEDPDQGPGWQTRMLSRPGAVGRYKLMERVGRGSMGEVWLAEDPEIARPVAVKVLRVPGHLTAERRELWEERSLREARAVGRLSHAGIISVYDVGKTADGRPYIVMEWVDGDSLGDILRTGALPSEEAILEWGAQIAEALHSAHNSGIVHRDVKPQNILIDRNHRARILDFGLARFPDSDLTQSGSFLGSPAFSSPEQIRGRQMDGRSDLFSLGSVLYTMITGVQPFRSEDLAGLAYEICHVEAVPPSCYADSVSKQADVSILKALAKEPERRYSNGHEMSEALRAAAAWDIEEALSSGFVSATPAGTPFSHLWRTSPGTLIRRGSKLLAHGWSNGLLMRAAFMVVSASLVAAVLLYATGFVERRHARPTAVESPIAASVGGLGPALTPVAAAGADSSAQSPGPPPGGAVQPAGGIATVASSTGGSDSGEDPSDPAGSGSSGEGHPSKNPSPDIASSRKHGSTDRSPHRDAPAVPVATSPSDPAAAVDTGSDTHPDGTGADPGVAALPADTSALVVKVRHRLADGQVTITAGDRVLVEEDLTTSRKKVKLFGRNKKGYAEWPVRIASGEATIRIRVRSEEKALDITRELQRTIQPDGSYEMVVVVKSGGSGDLSVDWSGTARAPEL